MNFVVTWIFKTVVGRWVTAILITSLLSGLAWKWHAFKEDLIHKGQQICVQEINKETVLQLEAALAAEKSARADLTAKLNAAALANQEARDRRRALEDQLTSLESQMENQRETDPDYKEWSDTALPDGVADRLRDAQTGDNPSPLRDRED